MYYIIYETTNTVNGKKYRGAHVCENLDDGYLGSGKRIIRAIQKYGKYCFAREILYMAFDYDAMWVAESILVDQSWVDRNDTYNLSVGGKGSNTYGRNYPSPTEDTRKKLSNASKGKPKSHHHRKNISAGVKKYLADPDARLQRSAQSKLCNARPEVRQKIAQALTGKKRSDETRENIKRAAIKRCADPKYLESQSISQTKRWQENPAIWWNNGVKNIRSVDQPGEDYQPGRISFGTWWTNGQKSVMSIECPGDGWSPGRKLHKVT